LKAQIKPSYDANRRKLADIIPLDTPFTVYIEPTRYCNFKCFYCMHATRGEKNGALEKTGLDIKHMPFSVYEKILDQLSRFPQRIKRIVFSGLGEPLIYPELPKMVEYAKKADIFERVDIITNASILSREKSDALIKAGLSRILISLQGLSSKKYSEVCGVSQDINELVENIRYFYENRKNCSVFVKIIDAILSGKEEEEKFFDMFGNICDLIYVEHLITLEQQMGDHNGLADNRRNLNNQIYEESDICPVIFYHININVDGDVFPCPVPGLPKSFSLGNIKEDELKSIWNGNRRKNLIQEHLKLNRKNIGICKSCVTYACINDTNERLDEYADGLLHLFES